jgi:hypothetical protein
LVDRLLPGAGPVQNLERHTGRESETRVTQSPVTRLTQKAAREYNEA